MFDIITLTLLVACTILTGYLRYIECTSDSSIWNCFNKWDFIVANICAGIIGIRRKTTPTQLMVTVAAWCLGYLFVWLCNMYYTMQYMNLVLLITIPVLLILSLNRWVQRSVKNRNIWFL